MDKKKVKELIEELRSIIYETKGKDSEDEANLTIALAAIQKIDIEFSKSDWVSVEDGLPEYGEKVWIRSKNNLPEIVGTDRRYRGCKEGSNVLDEYGFLTYYNATHWKPIDKLEE